MERVDPARSKQMARVRGRDTKPELAVRRALHAAGMRFRLHLRDLPGKPDIVLPSRRLAIFVHGCFWHRHPDPACKLARLPKTRLDFWLPKLEANRQRDIRNESALRETGWTVKTIWECELTNASKLTQFIVDCRETPQTGRLVPKTAGAKRER